MPVALLLLSAAVAVLAWTLLRLASQPYWNREAKKLGFELTSPRWVMHRASMRGRIGDLEVSLRYQAGENERTQVTIDSSGAVHPQLSIRRGRAERVREALGYSDKKTGDESFDDAMRIDGPPDVVSAALAIDVRRALVRLSSAFESFAIDNGKLTLEVKGELVDRALISTVEALCLLLRRLSFGRASLAARLIATAEIEEDLAARTVQFERFFALDDVGPLHENAINMAMASKHPPIVALGAASAGERGHSIAKTLLFNVELQDELRTMLFRNLVDSSVLALEDRKRLLEGPCGATLKVAVAQNIERLGLAAIDEDDGRGAIEALLISMLADQQESVQVPAASALGVIGSVSALEPLRLASHALMRHRLRLVAGEAMIAIRQREVA